MANPYTPPPLQAAPGGYNLGYRQTPVGQPTGPGMQMPGRVMPGQRQQNITQNVQAPAQAGTPASGGYEALVQAMMGQQAQGQADRQKRTGQALTWAPGNNMRNVGAGALSSFLGGRAQKKATAAKKEALRLSDDATQVEEMEQRKAVYDTLMTIQPSLTPEQALPMAKAVVNGQLKLEDIIPKATSQGAAAQEYKTLVDIYGEPEAKKKFATKYESKAEGDKSIPWAKASPEAKVKVSLVSSASNLISKALPIIFDEDGGFNNSGMLVPKGDVGIALADMREALTQSLRAVSGAAIPETEIEREVDAMVPTITDSDKQARQKIERARSKIERMHSALTSGYSDIPDNLTISSMAIGSGESDIDAQIKALEAEIAEMEK
jgi:hypothetical protein